ncbi:MAG: tetratricopeptide repeat protein [Planctomycetota bacterium JB042]
MSTSVRPLAGLVSIALLVGCAAPVDHLASHAPKAQLFEGLGARSVPITTSSAEAQRYFDQGVTWMYAFNHDEAIRSFAKAAEIDPDCAMAWWGVAVCEGPNYNDPVMTDERCAAAWSALERARARIGNTTPRERALIEALEARYEAPGLVDRITPWPDERARLDRAYADAMATVWADHPDDSLVGTLYAEALMVLTPWKLYSLEKVPAEDTPTILATLERVMELDPGNPGANHLYIHAIEPSADPGQALDAAARLSDQVPGAGHLNHMPSHIYVQTGHWDESVRQNARAMEADALYRERSPDQGIQHMYMAHNAHMLAFSAMMAGREAEALAAARSIEENIPDEVQEQVAGYLDPWMGAVYDVQKRFGRWDDLLAEPAPPAFFPITTAVWRAHRAIAYAAKKEIEAAEREYAEFRSAMEAIPDDSVFGDDPTHAILDVSDHFVAGEIALQQGEWDAAIEHLERAVEAEDLLSYGEPPQWLQPTRHTLGAVYLKAGRPAEAERVYRADLAEWRHNGWSLYGLYRALEEQGKTAEAEEVRRAHLEAWAKADAPLLTSCKCIPRT